MSTTTSLATVVVISALVSYVLGVVSVICICGFCKLILCQRKKFCLSKNEARQSTNTVIYDEADLSKEEVNLKENVSYGQIKQRQ